MKKLLFLLSALCLLASALFAGLGTAPSSGGGGGPGSDTTAVHTGQVANVTGLTNSAGGVITFSGNVASNVGSIRVVGDITGNGNGIITNFAAIYVPSDSLYVGSLHLSESGARLQVNGTDVLLAGEGGGGGETNQVFLLGNATLQNSALPNSRINPDAPYNRWIATTNAMDDEFANGSTDMTKWTWYNQGPRSVTNINGECWLMAGPAAASNNGGITQPVPATPYEFTTLVKLWHGNADYNRATIFFADATKLVQFQVVCNGGPKIAVDYNATNNYTSTPFTGTVTADQIFQVGYYFRIKDDGSNLIFSFSPSWDGQNFQVLLTVSRTAHLLSGPTKVGIGVDANNASVGCTNRVPFFRRTL